MRHEDELIEEALAAFRARAGLVAKGMGSKLVARRALGRRLARRPAAGGDGLRRDAHALEGGG
ncbi:MAG: SIMPL domain-containing protein [Myxococcota bacterium]